MIVNGGPTIRHLQCSKTVFNRVFETYKQRKGAVRELLTNARSRVNLSFDFWSTSNVMSLVGIIAHWINERRELRITLLALRRTNSHCSIDIAAKVRGVIEEYGTCKHPGGFQMDNATNSATTLEALADWYELDVSESRLRYFGHIINLVVKSLL